MILVSGISMPFTQPSENAVEYALKKIQKPAVSAKITKRAIDARRKHDIRFVYTVAVEVEGSEREAVEQAPQIKIVKDESLTAPREVRHGSRPVVAGFGPAGIFAALWLAKAGLRPVVLERGCDIDARVCHVEDFFRLGNFNPKSNVQFGEGGAGTFSDGKLTTRISDLRCAYVLKELVRHGAPNEILIDAKPHVGTDLLRNIVKSIRQEIILLGGEVRFNTKLTDIVIKNGRIKSVKTDCGEIETDTLILAPGHSARDTFETLAGKGIIMQPKSFSAGLRIEHLQSDVDKALYGSFAGHPLLPPASYQHSLRQNGVAVYTFCMCPGGVVVAAASEEGAVVTNGMSFHERRGKNANAAVVVSVADSNFKDAMQAVEFQRALELKAYAAAGGGYIAPASDVASFLKGKAGLVTGRVIPSYMPGVKAANFAEILPDEIVKMLKTGLLCFDGKQKGFAAGDGVLTGVETRTSSPLRIVRDETYCAKAVEGLYPCGEGAGYAGGIMSAAVDGIYCAQAVILRISKK